MNNFKSYLLCFTIMALLSAVLIFSPSNLDAQSKKPKTYPVQLQKISPRFWVHVSFKEYNGTPFNSNGLVAVSDKGLVLVDTCWNNDQTQRLLKKLKKKFNKDVALAIITHAHIDRIGGIEVLQKESIPVISIPLVEKFAVKAGFTPPRGTADPLGQLKKVGDLQFEIFYPGAGHTIDNSTVWFPNEKVLFGGCILKEVGSRHMGYIKEADVHAWPGSVRKLLKRYPGIKIAVPGHGKWGGVDVLNHTIKLIEEYNKKK